MRSPVSFHDKTPTARITSRMSNDVKDVDVTLPWQWSEVSEIPGL